ncbi:MAG TPA: SRPBCC family protein [Salinimicrobium sp.]|nr:SRPBCC family protein [Salinimicrobium sp.]
MKRNSTFCLPAMNPNVSKTERLVSMAIGSYFLYDSMIQRERNIPEALLAGYLLFRGTTGFCAVYNAIGKTKPDNRSRNINIRVNLQVDKPREEVYDFWRKLENLPLFMEHLDSVHRLNEGISVWEAKISGGIGHLRWKSEIVKERPNELLGWQSLPGSDVENAGKVEFHDLPDGGTELDVIITYHAPLGIPGEGVARVFNSLFEEMVRKDIENFKHYIENGASERNIKTTKGKFLV